MTLYMYSELIQQHYVYNTTTHVHAHLFLAAEKTVTVLFPYDGKLKDDLAMKPGDVITVDDWDASNDWARGTLNGKTGLFFKAFVKPSSEVPSPDDLKLKKVRDKPQGYEACYRRREYILKEKLADVACIICQELADNTHQTVCCGNTVCLQCASKWKERNNSCPQCRKEPLEIVVDPRTQRQVTGATVYCPNYCFGCDHVDGFGRMAQHLATECKFEGKECPNFNCKEVIPKKFLKRHTSNLCLWRHEACPCCGADSKTRRFSWRIPYQCIITDHCRKCPQWPTRCPNSCNPYLKLTQSTVDEHVKAECPETLIDCKFAEVGCKEKMRRKDLAQHMQDATSAHLTAVFEELMKMKHENAQLKRELGLAKPRQT